MNFDAAQLENFGSLSPFEKSTEMKATLAICGNVYFWSTISVSCVKCMFRCVVGDDCSDRVLLAMTMRRRPTPSSELFLV